MNTRFAKFQTTIFLWLTAAIGFLAFTWPLYVKVNSPIQQQAHWLFILLLPLILAVAISAIAHQKIDVREIAILGVLIAFAATLRTLGAGQAGIEPIWLPLILGARVFGKEFAFLLGTLALFTSALLTGGVGPWLPYQMLAACAVTVGAALLPNFKGKKEIALLAIYAVVASLAYGLMMDLQFWPWLGSTSSSISYAPGANVVTNLQHFLLFHVTTGLAWDIPRAIFTVVLIIFLGRPLLNVLHRVKRRAAFI